MYRPTSARLAAVITFLPVVVSCGHDSPTTPASRSAELTVHATTLASFSDGTIGVVASYRQQGDQLVPVAAKPSSIPIVRGSMAQQSVEVDLAACLGDSKRADAAQPGCPLVVELELRNASGAIIDRQDASPPSRVMPGQVADMPAVALTEIKSVTITPPTSSSLHPGETVQLTAAVRASDGSVVSDHPVSWSTSSAAAATVNASTGEVTAVAPGAVTITATVGEKTDQTAFTVATRVASVTLSPSPVTMDWNTQDTAKVTLTVTAFDASGAPVTDLAARSIVWASDDTTTATVAATDQPGQERVTGVLMGKTTISATVDGVRGTMQLAVQPEFGYFNNGGLPTLAVGDSILARMYFVTANGEREPIDGSMPGSMSFVSMNPAVATVSATGVLTGVAVGSAEIRGSYRGYSVGGTVTVVSVAKVEVSITMLTLEVFQTAQVTAVARDARGNRLDRVITWESEAPGLASVSSSGVVTGRAPGATAIHAFAEGVDGTIYVTVLPPSVATISVTPATLALNVGATGTLVATPRDVNGNVLTWPLSWTTSNSAVATVNAGIVTAVGAGRATIVATGGLKTASATVTVGAPNAPSDLTVGFGSNGPLSYTIPIGWADNSDNEDEFQVERAVAGMGGFELFWKVPGSSNRTGTAVDKQDFAELTLYTYRVRACNAVGCSAYLTPKSVPGPLREPTNLVAGRDGSGVRLTWQDNSAREEGYSVQAKFLDATGNVTSVSFYNLPPNTTEFVTPGGAPGTTVFYHVVPYANVPGYGYFEGPFGPNSQRFTF